MFKKLFGKSRSILDDNKEYWVGDRFSVTPVADNNLLINIPNMGKFLFNPPMFMLDEYIRLGVVNTDNKEDKNKTPIKPKKEQAKLKDLPITKLEHLLSEALNREDYKAVDRIQKIINDREDKK